MKNQDPVIEKVKALLDKKHFEIVGWVGGGRPRAERVTREWNDYLRSIGARRVGKLMGIVMEANSGDVRLDDPHPEGGNHGFIDMTREFAEKVAVLGLP